MRWKINDKREAKEGEKRDIISKEGNDSIGKMGKTERKKNLGLVRPSPSTVMSNGKQKCQLVKLIEDKSIVIIIEPLTHVTSFIVNF